MMRFGLAPIFLIAALSLGENAYARDKGKTGAASGDAATESGGERAEAASEEKEKEKDKDKPKSKKAKSKDKSAAREKDRGGEDDDTPAETDGAADGAQAGGGAAASARKPAVSAPEPNASAKPAKSEISELLDRLEYPELQVVPRATERLRIEAQEERSTWFITHWQLELSGLATFYNATNGKSQLRKDLSANDKNNAETITMVGQAVGLGWTAAGVLIGMRRPYRAGMGMIAKYEGKDMRSMILRERLAEEALERPARTMRPLRWISVLSNFSMNVLTGIYLTDEARMTAGVAALLSFLPLMYEDHTILVYEKHLEYKSKIYGPIASVSPGFDVKNRTLIPMARLMWAF